MFFPEENVHQLRKPQVGVSARGDRRGASGRWGAASAPQPEVRTRFQACAHTPVPGTLLAGAKAPRRRGHTACCQIVKCVSHV